MLLVTTACLLAQTLLASSSSEHHTSEVTEGVNLKVRGFKCIVCFHTANAHLSCTRRMNAKHASPTLTQPPPLPLLAVPPLRFVIRQGLLRSLGMLLPLPLCSCTHLRVPQQCSLILSADMQANLQTGLLTTIWLESVPATSLSTQHRPRTYPFFGHSQSPWRCRQSCSGGRIRSKAAACTMILFCLPLKAKCCR